jgi:hypothetical protein
MRAASRWNIGSELALAILATLIVACGGASSDFELPPDNTDASLD